MLHLLAELYRLSTKLPSTLSVQDARSYTATLAIEFFALGAADIAGLGVEHRVVSVSGGSGREKRILCASTQQLVWVSRGLTMASVCSEAVLLARR